MEERLRHEVEDDFAIDRGLEDGALGLEIVAQQVGVDEIAVVADRRSARARNRRRWAARSRSCWSRWWNSGRGRWSACRSVWPGSASLKICGTRPMPWWLLEFLVAIAMRDDAGAFLPAMLQGVETHEGDRPPRADDRTRRKRRIHPWDGAEGRLPPKVFSLPVQLYTIRREGKEFHPFLLNFVLYRGEILAAKERRESKEAEGGKLDGITE